MNIQINQENDRKFTEQELQVINAFSYADEFDGKLCQCIDNIRDITGLSTKVLRGVLSSLMQKNAVTVGEYPNGLTAFYLND